MPRNKILTGQLVPLAIEDWTKAIGAAAVSDAGLSYRKNPKLRYADLWRNIQSPYVCNRAGGQARTKRDGIGGVGRHSRHAYEQ
jgi:hypothetical protein